MPCTVAQNACVKRCGFCAFSRTGVDTESYYLPTDEVLRRVREARGSPASHMTPGIAHDDTAGHGSPTSPEYLTLLGLCPP